MVHEFVSMLSNSILPSCDSIPTGPLTLQQQAYFYYLYYIYLFLHTSLYKCRFIYYFINLYLHWIYQAMIEVVQIKRGICALANLTQ